MPQPHYMFGLTKITDMAGMARYASGVEPTVERYGGRFLVQGDVVEVLEGSIEASGGVIIEFNDAESAKGWYDSPEYTKLRQMRTSFGQSNLVLMRRHGSS